MKLSKTEILNNFIDKTAHIHMLSLKKVLFVRNKIRCLLFMSARECVLPTILVLTPVGDMIFQELSK